MKEFWLLTVLPLCIGFLALLIVCVLILQCRDTDDTAEQPRRTVLDDDFDDCDDENPDIDDDLKLKHRRDANPIHDIEFLNEDCDTFKSIELVPAPSTRIASQDHLVLDDEDAVV